MIDVDGSMCKVSDLNYDQERFVSMARAKGSKEGTVEEIDRQIAALQAERAKAVRKKETEALSAFKSFLKTLAAERLTEFVMDVKKLCDNEVSSRG